MIDRRQALQILFVEDDEQEIQEVFRMLRKHHLTNHVRHCHIAQAHTLLATMSDIPHLVLMMWRSDDVSRRELLTQIRQHNHLQALPFILVMSHPDDPTTFHDQVPNRCVWVGRPLTFGKIAAQLAALQLQLVILDAPWHDPRVQEK